MEPHHDTYMQPDQQSNQQPALRVDEPCPMSWMSLEGNSRKKFCGKCQLHVHNAEEMTRQEAQDLVRNSAERVCMRIVTDQAGHPLFKSEPVTCESVSGESVFSSRLRAAGLALAAGGILAACQPSISVKTANDGPHIIDQEKATSAPIVGTDPEVLMDPTIAPPSEHPVIMGTIAVPQPDTKPDLEPITEPPTAQIPMEVMGAPVAPEFPIEPNLEPYPEESVTPLIDPKAIADNQLKELMEAHIRDDQRMMLGRVVMTPPHGIELPAIIDPGPDKPGKTGKPVAPKPKK